VDRGAGEGKPERVGADVPGDDRRRLAVAEPDAHGPRERHHHRERHPRARRDQRAVRGRRPGRRLRPARRLGGALRRSRASLVALVVSLAGAAAAPAQRTTGPAPLAPAQGGVALLRGAETARRTLVARVESVGPVDAQARRAALAVERDLASDAPAAPGETVAIAWEELAEGRPDRFQRGERLLVALDPLPGQSLWRQRFPKRDALAVAERGAAFLRDPDDVTVDRLARYLHVAPAERSEAPGVEALAAIAAGAAAPLAEGAVQRLEAIPGLATKLREPAAAALGGAIASAQRPEALRRALLRLAASRRLDALREPIRAVADAGPTLAGEAWSALAAIDGGLPADIVKQLLGSDDAGVRAVAVRHAEGTPEEPRALAGARSDPSPEVRAAALEALIPTRNPEALEAGYAALFDRDAEVRVAASQTLGQLGAEVVPRLRELALARSGPEASGPLGALAFAGPEGQAALLELSHTHPDARTRGLARLLLGLDPKAH
jgi:hypothetical protein